MSENAVTRSLIEALTKRVADLEQEIAALKRQAATEPAKDWRSTVGMFTGDEVMAAIFEEGRKIREADREKARKAAEPRKRRKSRKANA